MINSTHPLSIRKKILFSIFLFLLVFGAPESFLRWQGFFPKDPGGRHIIYLEDPENFWVLAPNLQSERWLTFKNDTCVYIPLTTNSNGFREDHDIPNQKPEGEYRILALGDSVTMGYGLQKSQTYEDLLEKEIRGFLESPQVSGQRFKSVEVINTGVNGYTTDQEHRIMIKRGFKFDPDLVLLQVCENDISEFHTRKYRPKSARVSRELGFYQLGEKNTIGSAMVRTFIRHSSLFTYFDEMLLKARMKAEATNIQKFMEESEKTDYQTGFETYAEAVRAVYRDATARSQFLLLLFPQWCELSSGTRSVFAEKTIDYAKTNKIPYYELLFDMIDLAAQKGLARDDLNVAHGDRPRDTHLNPDGSRLAAELIYRYLKEERFLD